jgi:hypothetical protein
MAIIVFSSVFIYYFLHGKKAGKEQKIFGEKTG